MGKPSASSLEEYSFGEISVRYVLKEDRITFERLRKLIEDEEHTDVIVAKLKITLAPKIVG